MQATEHAPIPPRRNPGQTRKSRVEVHLRSRPQYVPGNGPPLLRISLLPPRDSTAYIVDKITLPSPGLAADGKPLPKRWTYIVGWTDLPAARLLVPAMQVLDYVSPQVFEAWEWETAEQLDRESARLQRSKEKETPKPKKKRGRPPAHSQIEAAVVAKTESATTVVPKKGVMSIATPTKDRLKDFEGLSDDERSPNRQLGQELRESTGTGMEDALDDMGLVRFPEDYKGMQAIISDEAFGPRGSGNQILMQKHTANKQVVVSGIESDSMSSKGTSTQRSSPGSITVADTRPKQTPIKATVQTTLPALRTVPGEGRGSMSGLDYTPVDQSNPATPSKLTTMPKQTPIKATVQTTLPALRTVPGEGRGSMSGLDSTPVDQSKPATPNKLTTSTAHRKETPKSSKLDEKEQKSEPSKKPQKKTPKPSRISSPLVDEPTWEVKRVEDMEIFEVEGLGRVRYFKIRWEGDWPPDQNPSWEPEDNLPPALIRNYLDRKKKKPAAPTPALAPVSTGKKKSSLKQTTLPWGIPARQYQSVSEAFAGGEDMDNGDALGDPVVNENAEDASEELFVVEEPAAKRTKTGPSWKRNTNGDRELGIMSMFR